MCPTDLPLTNTTTIIHSEQFVSPLFSKMFLFKTRGVPGCKALETLKKPEGFLYILQSHISENVNHNFPHKKCFPKRTEPTITDGTEKVNEKNSSTIPGAYTPISVNPRVRFKTHRFDADVNP
jgi:hypothetical protein